MDHIECTARMSLQHTGWRDRKEKDFGVSEVGPTL